MPARSLFPRPVPTQTFIKSYYGYILYKMHFISSLLLTLPALTSVALAAVIDLSGENSTEVLYFHNPQGEVVGERYLTKAELQLWADHFETTSDVAKLETRSNNDIVFWEHTYVTCANANGDYFCSPPYYDVQMTYTGFDICNDITTVDNFATNACWKSWSFYGNWYWVDQCNPNLDWGSAAAGSFIGNIYTYNNKYLGPCYATSHSYKNPTCNNGVEGNAWQSLVRCTLP
ncbi:hypothetical protein BBP40_002231 [Aspergillus hancockii]|nr:hypothetical protein BBP40_002231 [Aspergillus hancockii]